MDGLGGEGGARDFALVSGPRSLEPQLLADTEFTRSRSSGFGTLPFLVGAVSIHEVGLIKWHKSTHLG